MDLTREIREIKKKSFPELKLVFTRGVYVPPCALGGAGAAAKCNVLRVSKEGEAPFFCAGFADIMIPEYLGGNLNARARRGIIAHELGHIVSEKKFDEYSADEEAIRRGEGINLYVGLKKLEGSGFQRCAEAYDSAAILTKILHHYKNSRVRLSA